MDNIIFANKISDLIDLEKERLKEIEKIRQILILYLINNTDNTKISNHTLKSLNLDKKYNTENYLDFYLKIE